ncbi:hypothetical protein Y1Q_0013603 [Alligator mississippiensis]|uniref:Uncharacterized protein n=1 Tax=Alligator mississippiensis TaxID=8496 RepID=A0A151P3S4_ALLMI|nr:hypothetical protein Y1Q_0013603 [Alligator mississippiensis]
MENVKQVQRPLTTEKLCRLCSCTWERGLSWQPRCGLRVAATQSWDPVDTAALQKEDPGSDPPPGQVSGFTD